LWAKLCFDFVAIVSQWQSASDEDWALALAREAVIRPLTDQPEVIEELVVTASDELGMSRSLVYRLVAKFRTAATGLRIEAVCWYWRFAPIIIVARQQIPENRELSTI
jgi:hypothetical protein